MTDTSIVKPLRWDDDNRTSNGYGVSITYGIYEARDHWRTTLDTARHPNREGAKIACFKHYEALHLSAIDLTAHDAAVRAEALEEASILLRNVANNMRVSGKPQCDSDIYRHAANLLSKRAARNIRSLKGEG